MAMQSKESLWPPSCWDYVFEPRHGNENLSLVLVVQVQASATSWTAHAGESYPVCVLLCVIKCNNDPLDLQ